MMIFNDAHAKDKTESDNFHTHDDDAHTEAAILSVFEKIENSHHTTHSRYRHSSPCNHTHQLNEIKYHI
jgi:hypothetical protein